MNSSLVMVKLMMVMVRMTRIDEWGRGGGRREVGVRRQGHSGTGKRVRRQDRGRGEGGGGD